MNTGDNIILPPLLFGFNPYIHFFPLLTGNNFLNINPINPLNFLKNENSSNINNTIAISNEINQVNSINEDAGSDSTQSLEKANEEKNKINFNINNSPKKYLFKISNANCVLNEGDANSFTRKRLRVRKPRKYNNDNIRIKIKRGFLNVALIKKLNNLLKNIASNQKFVKFPHSFIKDVNKGRNMRIMNITLREIFENEELYKDINKNSRENYLHNLQVVKSEEIKTSDEFDKILNKTFKELYEEYINSDEFKIVEINHLKMKNMDDEYIQKYIYLAREFIDFFNG